MKLREGPVDKERLEDVPQSFVLEGIAAEIEERQPTVFPQCFSKSFNSTLSNPIVPQMKTAYCAASTALQKRLGHQTTSFITKVIVI